MKSFTPILMVCAFVCGFLFPKGDRAASRSELRATNAIDWAKTQSKIDQGFADVRMYYYRVMQAE